MKKLIFSLFLAVSLLFSFATPSLAYRVRGYTRSNGTYVNSYYRSRGNAYKYDNYSYKLSQPRYNSSYYSGRSYGSRWYTPSYSDSGYSYEKSIYNLNHGY